jgi:hypothetical protein
MKFLDTEKKIFELCLIIIKNNTQKNNNGLHWGLPDMTAVSQKWLPPAPVLLLSSLT